MKCYNCNKNAMYAVGEEGKQIPLCLDCYIKLENINLQKQEAYQREINYLTEEMESTVGMRGVLPRYPEPTPRYIIQGGGVTLNNIHVSNSEIGVLNTGNIQNVDSTVTVLKGSGENELAAVIKNLTEAVIKSNEISTNQKNQIIELVSSLAEEAVVPKEKRKTAVFKAIFSELKELLKGITSLATIWDKAKLILEQIIQ